MVIYERQDGIPLKINRRATVHLTAAVKDLSAPFNPQEIFATSLNEKIEAKLKEVQA